MAKPQRLIREFSPSGGYPSCPESRVLGHSSTHGFPTNELEFHSSGGPSRVWRRVSPWDSRRDRNCRPRGRHVGHEAAPRPTFHNIWRDERQGRKQTTTYKKKSIVVCFLPLGRHSARSITYLRKHLPHIQGQPAVERELSVNSRPKARQRLAVEFHDSSLP